MDKPDCKNCITYAICRTVLLDRVRYCIENGLYERSFRDVVLMVSNVLDDRCSLFEDYYQNYCINSSIPSYITSIVDNFDLVESEILNGQT